MYFKVGKFSDYPMPCAVALCMTLTTTTFAQQAPNEITIIAEPPVRVSGFDGVSQQELPLSTTSIDNATLRDIGTGMGI